MNIKLDKPLLFFDLETTGLNIGKDKIIELAVIKFMPQSHDGPLLPKNAHEKCRRLNPYPVEMTPESINMTGIDPQSLKDEPKFEEIASSLHDFIKDCDLVGHNIIRFDVPMLREEFLRCGIDWPRPSTRIIDTMVLYRKFASASLGNVYRLFTGKDLVDAHGAMPDTAATVGVLENMLTGKEICIRATDHIGTTVQEMYDVCKESYPEIDYAARLAFDVNGKVVFNFGINKGTPILEKPDYCKWMILNDFPQDTVEIIKKVYREMGKKLEY